MVRMRAGTIRFTSVRSRNSRIVFGAVALTLLAATIASAHDTWLISMANFTRVNSSTRVDLTSGEHFAAAEFAIEPGRVVRAVVRENGAIADLPRPKVAGKALAYTWKPTIDGTATLGIELKPRTLVLQPKLIDEYLGEIDATPEIRAQWKALGGKRQWTEAYTKHALTFFQVAPESREPGARARADSSWARPIGLGLELVPERDPTELTHGDTLTIRVLLHGAPLQGFSVGAIREGRDKTIFSKTDVAGRAVIVFDAPGRWLLNGTYLRRSTRATTVWESDFVTATFHIFPAAGEDYSPGEGSR
jgi:hypothetical protein